MFQKLWQYIDSIDYHLATLAVGVSGFIYKAFKYKINNEYVLAKEASSCLFVCMVFMPFVKDLFNLTEITSYLFTWAACTATGETKENEIEL